MLKKAVRSARESLASSTGIESSTAKLAASASAAFTLAMSSPELIDQRLANLSNPEDWKDGPDGVAMSTLQREAYTLQLRKQLEPFEMAEEAEAEARAALKRFRALNGEQEGDTEAERFVQRQEREAAALVAEEKSEEARRTRRIADVHELRKVAEQSRSRAEELRKSVELQGESAQGAEPMGDISKMKEALAAAEAKADTDAETAMAFFDSAVADGDMQEDDRAVASLRASFGSGSSSSSGDGNRDDGTARAIPERTRDEKEQSPILRQQSSGLSFHRSSAGSFDRSPPFSIEEGLASDGIVRPSTRTEEKLLARLDPRIWTENWDPLPTLFAGLPGSGGRRRRDGGLDRSDNDESSDDDDDDDEGNRHLGSSSSSSSSSTPRREFASMMMRRKKGKPKTAASSKKDSRDNKDENEGDSDPDGLSSEDDSMHFGLRTGPSEATYVEAKMADADQGMEIVLSRLGKHVTEHCEELIEGMTAVKQIDDNLHLGSLIAGNARRMLKAADERLNIGSLRITQLERRRMRLMEVRKVLKRVTDLVELEKSISDRARAGDFVRAIELAVEAKDKLEEGADYDDDDEDDDEDEDDEEDYDEDGEYEKYEDGRPALAAESQSANTGKQSDHGSSETRSGSTLPLSKLKLLRVLRIRINKALPELRRIVDRALWRIVAGHRGKYPTHEGNAPAEEEKEGEEELKEKAAEKPPFESLDAHHYAQVVRAYNLLDDLGITLPQVAVAPASLTYRTPSRTSSRPMRESTVMRYHGARGRHLESLVNKSKGDVTDMLHFDDDSEDDEDDSESDSEALPSGHGDNGSGGGDDGNDGELDEDITRKCDDPFLTDPHQVTNYVVGSGADVDAYADAALLGEGRGGDTTPDSDDELMFGTSTRAVLTKQRRIERGARDEIRRAEGIAARQIIAMNGHRGAMSSLPQRIERFTIYQAERQTRLVLQRVLLASDSPIQPAATFEDFCTAHGLARLLEGVDDADLVECCSQLCGVLSDLLHRHWLLTTWHGMVVEQRAKEAREAIDTSEDQATTENNSDLPYESCDRLFFCDAAAEAQRLCDKVDGEPAVAAGPLKVVPATATERPAKDSSKTTAASKVDFGPADSEQEQEVLDRLALMAAEVGSLKSKRFAEDARQHYQCSDALTKTRPAVWRACEQQLMMFTTALDVGGASSISRGGGLGGGGGGGGGGSGRVGSGSGGSDDDEEKELEDESQEREGSANVKLETLACITAMCQLFSRIGREFCSLNVMAPPELPHSTVDSNRASSNMSSIEPPPLDASGLSSNSRLEGCLRLKAKQFFSGLHAEQLQAMRVIVENDMWHRLAVEITGAASTKHSDDKERLDGEKGETSPLNISDALVVTAPGPLLTEALPTSHGRGSTVHVLSRSHRKYSGVRRLTKSTLYPLTWPGAVLSRPAVLRQLHRRVAAFDRLWTLGHTPQSQQQQQNDGEVSQHAAASELIVRATIATARASTVGADPQRWAPANQMQAQEAPRTLDGRSLFYCMHRTGNPFRDNMGIEPGENDPPSSNASFGAAENSGGGGDDHDSDDDGMVLHAHTSSVTPLSSEEKEEGRNVRRAEERQFGSSHTITSGALNGFTRSVGRYMQVMALLPAVAEEAHAGLLQLFTFYVYAVGTLFTPPRALKAIHRSNLLLQQRQQPPKEHDAAFSMDDNDVDEDDFERDDGSESTSTTKKNLSLGIEGADDEDHDEEHDEDDKWGASEDELSAVLLSSDERLWSALRRFMASAAVEFTPGEGVGLSSGEATGTFDGQRRGAFDTLEVLRPPLPLPVCIEGAREESLYSIGERVVATESLSFVAQVLTAAQPQLVTLLAAAELQSDHAASASKSLNHRQGPPLHASSSSSSNSSFFAGDALERVYTSPPFENQGGGPIAHAVMASGVANVRRAAIHCERFVQSEALPTTLALRHLIYRSAARRLVRARSLAKTIAEQPSWDSGYGGNGTAVLNGVRSSVGRVGGLVGKGLKGFAAKGLNLQPSTSSSSDGPASDTHSGGGDVPGSTGGVELPYVDVVVRDCEKAWAVLCGESHDAGHAGGDDATAGDDTWDAESIMVAAGNLVPFRARELLWSETVQAVHESLVEGYSRVPLKKCSTVAGRQAMADDVGAVQLGLDRIHRPNPRPARGKVYVEAYLKAFQSVNGKGEEELVRWISQNWEHYQQRHMVALITNNSALARTRSKHKRELVSQVKALYAPPPLVSVQQPQMVNSRAMMGDRSFSEEEG